MYSHEQYSSEKRAIHEDAQEVPFQGVQLRETLYVGYNVCFISRHDNLCVDIVRYNV